MSRSMKTRGKEAYLKKIRLYKSVLRWHKSKWHVDHYKGTISSKRTNNEFVS